MAFKLLGAYPPEDPVLAAKSTVDVIISDMPRPRYDVEPTSSPRRAHVEPTSSPRRAHVEPTSSPRRAHVEPTSSPRSSTGPLAWYTLRTQIRIEAYTIHSRIPRTIYAIHALAVNRQSPGDIAPPTGRRGEAPQRLEITGPERKEITLRVVHDRESEVSRSRRWESMEVNLGETKPM